MVVFPIRGGGGGTMLLRQFHDLSRRSLLFLLSLHTHSRHARKWIASSGLPSASSSSLSEEHSSFWEMSC